MPVKSLSPYPPDLWIRELNKRYPNLWTDLRKSYSDPGNHLKLDTDGLLSLQNVPDWCIMPTMFPFLMLTNHYGPSFFLSHENEIMTLATLYTWRASKGIYRFAPEIYTALVHQKLTGDLPTECLYHLPEWAVYVETPGLTYERTPVDGFIAHLDYNLFSKAIDLQFAIFQTGRIQPKMIALPLGKGSLLDAMDRVDQVDDAFMISREKRYIGTREEYLSSFSSMLQLLLYLCSEEPDMPEIQHPRYRKTISGGVRSPREPNVWDVGVRISRFIRNTAKKESPALEPSVSAQGTHSSPRPHVRSAHWHTYWTGPRQASFPERRPVIRWLPPIPVGIDWKKELPTHIRMLID